MDLQKLFKDEGAVSPVIGVILMVAITVILAAVIGTFVLGLGDQVQSNAPSASFTFDYDETGTTLTVTHDGGDAIDRARLEVKSDGTVSAGTWPNTEVSAGDSMDISGVDPGETVRIVWTASSGDNTATLGKWTGPDA